MPSELEWHPDRREGTVVPAGSVGREILVVESLTPFVFSDFGQA